MWDTTLSYTAAIVTYTIFFIGMITTVLPILPGTVIAFGGVLVHKLWMGPASVSWTFVLVCAALAAASLAFDTIFAWWGAKRYGASWKGALGAIVGGIAGIFLLTPLVGLFVGPIVGAIGFELLDGRTREEAARAGWGTFLGTLAATAIKMVCTIGIISGFIVAQWPA